MVSGLVTSPDDQSRICLLDARPIRIASNSLISIKALLRPAVTRLLPHRPALRRAGRPVLRPLPWRGRPARRRPQRARREVDPELLRRAQQLVVLLAHLDLLALVREDVHVERER